MPDRPNLDQGHGVRFERVITRHIKRLAEASHLTYSEMTRVLVDEAILARLTRTDLDREVLREAALHAIEHQARPEYTHKALIDLDEPVYPIAEMLKEITINNAALLQEFMQRALDDNDPAVRAVREEEELGWD